MSVVVAMTSMAYSTNGIFAQSEQSNIEEIEMLEYNQHNTEIGEVDQIFESESTLIDITEGNTETEALENKESIQYVEKTVGDVEINEANFPDSTFRRIISSLSFDENRDGILSIDELDAITSIHIRNNLTLKSLKGIEHFYNLTDLICVYTGITSVNISENQKLRRLDLQNNKYLTSLDVSNNLDLKSLYLSYSGITSLDVSNNELVVLQIFDTPMAYLEMGNQKKLLGLDGVQTTVSLKDVGSSFNIKDYFPGIDINKVTMLDGGTLDSNTGIMSGYTQGNLLVYKYDCGTSLKGKENLRVVLKWGHSIEIKDDLNKIYDGQPVNPPTNIITTADEKDLKILWYTETGTRLSSAPIAAGNYIVKAIFEESDHLAGVEAEKAFTISRAPSTITINDSLDKIYDGQEVKEPTDIVTTGSTGYVSYEWYTVDGVRLEKAPIEAGRYKVKAILHERGNYDRAEVEKEFEITKANSSITIHDDLNKVYDGQAVKEPSITQVGSQSLPVFEWYTIDGVQLENAPIEVGSYKLVVSVAEDKNHNGITAEVEFEIKEALQENNVQTGDSTQVGLWAILVILSTGMMIFFIKNKYQQ